MKTAVVILNWNTERYLRSFLPGLVASCPHDARIIVADSGSADASLEWVERECPDVGTVPLGGNYGFSGGYNRALEGIDAEYFVLINSDVDVPQGWLEPLVSYMDTHPQCGVCGPKLHALELNGDGSYSRTSRFEYAGAAGGYIDRYGYPFCRGRVLKRVDEDRGQYDSQAPLLWVSGACMLTRASLWKQLGGFDDRFFAHMEEIDYCWRAQRLGWSVALVPESTVWHLGGGTLASASPWKLELNFRNNLLLLDNNLASVTGAGTARMRIFLRMLLDGAAALLYLVSARPAYARAVLRAHRAYRVLRLERPAMPESGRPVKGYWKKCIILQGLLRGKGVLEYIERFEKEHLTI